MTIDVTRQIGAITRELTTRDYEGRPARVLVALRTYDTTIEDLWDALTNPERLPRWFAPVSGDFRVGGRYEIEGNASGEITACDPPEHLALTWGMHGQVSWVNFDLSEHADGGTLLRLEHIAHVPEDFWERYGPGAVGVGWDQALLGLDLHFAPAGTATVTPETAMEWVMSDEGRSYVRMSSDAWGDASIAAGTEPAAARAAAERTRAFYTGEESGSS